jgi:hypothetical protein
MDPKLPQPLQVPTGAANAPQKNAPLMFVMPPAYRHGAKPMAVPKPAAVPAPAPMPMAPPPAPKPPMPTGKPVPKKKKGIHKGIVIAGLLLLALLGGGGYFMLRSVQPAPVPTPVPTPVPAPAPTPVPEPEPIPEPEPPAPTGPVPGADQDADGLTDLEEQIVYGSDPANPDTDGDGYPDLLEVANRYNPAAVAPRTLLEAGTVKEYENAKLAILYPSAWTVSEADGAVKFTASTGETFSVGGDGEFSMDVGIKTTVDYRATFDMMINSVRAKPLP